MYPELLVDADTIQQIHIAKVFFEEMIMFTLPHIPVDVLTNRATKIVKQGKKKQPW